jgi:hypothetical protein
MEVQEHNYQCEAGKLTRFIEILPVHVQSCVKDIHEGPLEAHRRGIDQETGLPFPALPE